MASTKSTMMPIGTIAPYFQLLDTVSNKKISLAEVKGGKATVIMFICNHCPYVKHVNQELVKMANEYQPKGVHFIAISSNDVDQYPEDGLDMMKKVAKSLHYPFPYLFDESQEVAKAYNAVCTPDFFVFNHQLECAYRGQLDDSRPGNGIPASGKFMRSALDQIIAGKNVTIEQIPSIGCNIKWKR